MQELVLQELDAVLESQEPQEQGYAHLKGYTSIYSKRQGELRTQSLKSTHKVEDGTIIQEFSIWRLRMTRKGLLNYTGAIAHLWMLQVLHVLLRRVSVIMATVQAPISRRYMKIVYTRAYCPPSIVQKSLITWRLLRSAQSVRAMGALASAKQHLRSPVLLRGYQLRSHFPLNCAHSRWKQTQEVSVIQVVK